MAACLKEGDRGVGVACFRRSGDRGVAGPLRSCDRDEDTEQVCSDCAWPCSSDGRHEWTPEHKYYA